MFAFGVLRRCCRMTLERFSSQLIPDPPEWEVVDRYLLRTATAEEVAAVDAYFAAVTRSGEGGSLLRDALLASPGYPAGTPPADIVRRLRAYLDTRPVSRYPHPPRVAIRRARGFFVPAMTAVVLLAGGITS